MQVFDFHSRRPLRRCRPNPSARALRRASNALVSELETGLEAIIQETLALQVKQYAPESAKLPAALRGTSIYATGSVGRLEAGEYSDLDVFVISGALNEKTLGRLEHYELITDLIRTARVNGFPRFSRDGEFLTSHALDDLVGEAGRPEDDYNNRLTARMLLLLESRCLFGSKAYEDAVARVLGHYWPVSETVWLPFFLINDLVRYWKTVCLNYEGFKRKDDPPGKRRLALLKLRYSRMWTCFSGLAYLLAGLDGNTIPRSRALDMVDRTPAERMRDIADDRLADRATVNELLALYVAFLELTSGSSKGVLEARLASDTKLWTDFKRESDHFGWTMHRLITSLTARAPVERFLLI